jgi:hypothetical protein
MKIEVQEYERTSPYESLYSPLNSHAKRVLKHLDKDHFSKHDLCVLEKLGCEIITHTCKEK